MEYLLKASGIVIILFGFYQLFLKNETFFLSIRSYFLLGLVVVLAIPFIEIPVYVEVMSSQLNLDDYQELVTGSAGIADSIDWLQLAMLTYLLGVMFFTVKFLLQLGSLGLLLWNHQVVKKGPYHFIETNRNIPPFSFFNIIVYNRSQYEIEELEQILNHEKAHASQWHSVDTLLAHLLVITLWFNPFVWLYKKAVQQNLEFLADSHALKLADNRELYQHTLLKTCSSLYCTQISNNFYNSLIKKRIIMLHKNRSKNRSQWRYMLLFPLLAAFIFTFNTKIVAQEKESVKDHEKKDNNELVEVHEIHVIDLVINKNTSDEKLDKIKSKFKEEAGVSLIFKGVKRNENGEITALKIEAKGKKTEAKFYADADGEAIKPVKISYNSESDGISIGNLSKEKKKGYHITVHDDGKVEKHVVFEGKPEKHGNFVFVGDDGKKVEWTVKGDKKENIEVVVVGEDGHKENVWIHKKDKGHHEEVDVIEIVEKDGKVKVIKKADGKAKVIVKELVDVKEGEEENVYIIKGDKKEGKEVKLKKMKKGDMVFINDDMNKALVIIDGKETTHEALKNLDKESIEKIEVYKGDGAVEKYGDKAKDGVVVVTTKK
jgi:hypothetical protein